ncbi:MAG: hypothetical protein E3K32_09795 [wastewater metagenome]|nr:hypothetical protein [Candidatus Loosdrechtia aerotolerans]
MNASILNLSRQLIDALNLHSIDYCHWKNNHNLMKSLSGEDDLDLLINKNQFSDFIKIICSLGFKEAYNEKITFPFIYHFYGLDTETGILLHLHVHIKMITGESHTKNYHLPLEKMILENTTSHSSGCRIPQPEVELIIFILRYYIKISCLPGAILLWKRMKAFSSEFLTLYQNVDLNRVDILLQSYFQYISVEFFRKMLDEYTQRKVLRKRLFLGLALRRKLSPLRRMGVISSFFARYYQILYRALNKLVFREKKFLTTHGAIIAITGLDATGKSTITSELKRWLGTYFNTHFIHVGRPKVRLETVLFRAVLWLKKTKGSKPESFITKLQKPGVIFAIRYAVLAYERFQLLKKANRLMARGYIVICDRYPSVNFGKMDSPRIGERNGNAFINFMGRLEDRLYRTIPLPDVIYNLKIPVDLAIERNQARIKDDKETDDQLRLRYSENADLRYNAFNFEVIDTSRKLPVVLRELKEKVWEKL